MNWSILAKSSASDVRKKMRGKKGGKMGKKKRTEGRRKEKKSKIDKKRKLQNK